MKNKIKNLNIKKVYLFALKSLSVILVCSCLIFYLFQKFIATGCVTGTMAYHNCFAFGRDVSSEMFSFFWATSVIFTLLLLLLFSGIPFALLSFLDRKKK